jgi:hypothetical protein
LLEVEPFNVTASMLPGVDRNKVIEVPDMGKKKN